MILRWLAALLLLGLSWTSLAEAQVYIPSGTVPVVGQTTKSAANTAVTLTLAAPAAGLFHYITALEIAHGCTTAVVGTAFLDITSTNLNSLAWSQGDACAVGSDHILYYTFDPPIKATVAATATTIVCPAFGAAAFCRVTAYFFVGP